MAETKKVRRLLNWTNDEGKTLGVVVQNVQLIEVTLEKVSEYGKQLVVRTGVTTRFPWAYNVLAESIPIMCLFLIPTNSDIEWLETLFPAGMIFDVDTSNINETAWDAVAIKRGYAKIMTDVSSQVYYVFNVKGAKSSL